MRERKGEGGRGEVWEREGERGASEREREGEGK